MNGGLLIDHRTISASTIQTINDLGEQGVLVGIAMERDLSFKPTFLNSSFRTCAIKVSFFVSLVSYSILKLHNLTSILM